MELENLANHVSIRAGWREVSYVKEHSEVAFNAIFYPPHRNDKH